MSTKGNFKYTLKRQPEDPENTEQRSEKIPINLPATLLAFPPKQPRNRKIHVPLIPDIQFELSPSIKEAPIESQTSLMVEQLVNVMKTEIIITYSEHQLFKDEVCKMLDSILVQTKSQQKSFYEEKKRKTLKRNQMRENLANQISKEKEMWSQYDNIFKVNPITVQYLNKMDYIEVLRERLKNASDAANPNLSQKISVDDPEFPLDAEFKALAPKVRNKRIEQIQRIFAYMQVAHEQVRCKSIQNAYNALADFHYYQPIITANPVDLCLKFINSVSN